MKKVEILEQAMTYATLNQLYSEYCAKLLEIPSDEKTELSVISYEKFTDISEIPSDEKIELSVISYEDFTDVINFLCTNYDEDEYRFEEVYDMRTRQDEHAYIMADLQINETEYKDIEKKFYKIESINDDSYELSFDTNKSYGFVTLMPICFEQFYKYCEEVLDKKEKELNEKIKKEFPKDEKTITKSKENAMKNETNYRKIAEEFLENYDFITNSYESLSKVVNDEQLIDVFEMIFKNFGE